MPMILSGTEGGFFPSWTTATRPASPIVGQMGYNTTTGLFDQYTAGGWVGSLTNASQSIPATAFPAGSVLQVVSGSYSSLTSTTSSTFSNSGLAVTITPKSATSKILVVCNAAMFISTSGWSSLQVLRNGGSAYSPYASIGYKNDAYGISYPVAFNYVDSPATTSAVTYTLQFNSVNAPVIIYIQNDNRASTMSLMEIAA